jgi:hypothetical protein
MSPVVAVLEKLVPCDSVVVSLEVGCWGCSGCWKSLDWVKCCGIPFSGVLIMGLVGICVSRVRRIYSFRA